MSRLAIRLTFVVVLAALAFGGAGLARASVATLEGFAGGSLVPSGAPALLGPINELGRNGWHCIPEQAARSARVAGAELPSAGDAP